MSTAFAKRTTAARRPISNACYPADRPIADRERLEPEDRARELLVFGLRRMEGVARDWFAARSGFTRSTPWSASRWGDYLALGLFEDAGERMRLTREGLFVSDAIWPDFLAVEKNRDLIHRRNCATEPRTSYCFHRGHELVSELLASPNRIAHFGL